MTFSKCLCSALLCNQNCLGYSIFKIPTIIFFFSFSFAFLFVSALLSSTSQALCFAGSVILSSLSSSGFLVPFSFSVNKQQLPYDVFHSPSAFNSRFLSWANQFMVFAFVSFFFFCGLRFWFDGGLAVNVKCFLWYAKRLAPVFLYRFVYKITSLNRMRWSVLLVDTAEMLESSTAPGSQQKIG